MLDIYDSAYRKVQSLSFVSCPRSSSSRQIDCRVFSAPATFFDAFFWKLLPFSAKGSQNRPISSDVAVALPTPLLPVCNHSPSWQESARIGRRGNEVARRPKNGISFFEQIFNGTCPQGQRLSA